MNWGKRFRSLKDSQRRKLQKRLKEFLSRSEGEWRDRYAYGHNFVNDIT